MREKYYNEERYFDEHDDDVIDLLDIVFMFIRRWKVVVLLTIPVVMIGFFVASTRPSVYKADTTLIVSSGMQSVGLDNNDVALNQKLVITYSEIAKSRDVLRRVISKYDLQESPEALAKKISVSVVKDTELIKLDYVSHDPRLAEAVTNELAEEFIKKVGQVMRIRNVSIVERAIQPSRPLPKKRAMILVASVIFGVMFGMGGAFVIELLHKKVRKSSDIEKILGVQMLGMIPEIETTEKGEENHES